jgi:hypothetical protein
VARRTVIAPAELVEPKTSSVVPAGSAAAIRPSNATAGPTRRRIAVADAAQ